MTQFRQSQASLSDTACYRDIFRCVSRAFFC